MKTQTADRCTSVDPAIAAERRSKQFYIPIAHVHALMVASNPQRGGSHSAVVETSQRYNTAGIGVGLTHWDSQTKYSGGCIDRTWRFLEISRKVSEHHHQIAWGGLGSQH